MDDPPHITFVDTHAESDCGAHYLYAVIDEIVLYLVSIRGSESCMIDGCTKPVLLQHLCHFLCVAPAHAIDDAAFAGMAGDEIQDGLVLLFQLVSPLYGKAEIGPVERGNEYSGLDEMQLPYDVFACYLIGRSGKCNDGDVGKHLMYESHLRVFRTEIMSPL